jgi:hypothetical protein
VLSGEDVASLHVAGDLVDGAHMLVVSGEVSSGLDGLSGGDRAGEQRKDRKEGDELHRVDKLMERERISKLSMCGRWSELNEREGA